MSYRCDHFALVKHFFPVDKTHEIKNKTVCFVEHYVEMEINSTVKRSIGFCSLCVFLIVPHIHITAYYCSYDYYYSYCCYQSSIITQTPRITTETDYE